MTALEDPAAAGQIGKTWPAPENLSGAHAPDPLPFKIVFVYEDIETARRAIAASLKLAAGLNPDGKVDLRAWRLDLLEYSNHRADALTEVAKADAVVVSSRHTLPGNVRSWLDDCVAEKKDPGLIVVQLAATDEDWAIAIRNPVEFSGNSAGSAPALEQTFRCGYRAALPARRCL